MTPAELQQLLITRAPDVPGITGASPAGGVPASGPSGEDPVPVPNLTSRPVPVAHVEQALIATAAACAGGQVCSIDRYSTRPDPPAVRYGATIGSHDGWKLFLSCYGTTRCSSPTSPSRWSRPGTVTGRRARLTSPHAATAASQPGLRARPAARRLGKPAVPPTEALWS